MLDASLKLDKMFKNEYLTVGLLNVKGIALYENKKPLNLLIYYGWLNSFNSATLGWNNESVAKELNIETKLFSFKLIALDKILSN